MASFFCLELPNFVFWNAQAPWPAFAVTNWTASARERKIGKAPFGALRKSERSRARIFLESSPFAERHTLSKGQEGALGFFHTSFSIEKTLMRKWKAPS